MATLSELRQRFQTLNIRKQLMVGVEETNKALADIQREQMMSGLRSSGKKIGKYKSDAYARKKFAMNGKAGFGWKDLRLMGDFQSEILIKPDTQSVNIISLDSKTASIIEREGEDVFGLTKENAARYSKDHLADITTKNIKNHLHGV